MSYFTAVIAGNGSIWRARDVEIEDATDLDDLADILRTARGGRGPVLAVIEHEDEWFALVRVDGDDDPRVFVSDMAAASRGPYGELLAPATDVEVEDDDAPSDAEEDGVEPAEQTAEADSAADSGPSAEPAEPDDAADVEADLASARVDVKVRAWAGEPDLLEDMGIDGRRLRSLAEEQGDDPGTVLAEIGEECGFGGLLDALR